MRRKGPGKLERAASSHTLELIVPACVGDPDLRVTCSRCWRTMKLIDRQVEELQYRINDSDANGFEDSFHYWGIGWDHRSDRCIDIEGGK